MAIQDNQNPDGSGVVGWIYQMNKVRIDAHHPMVRVRWAYFLIVVFNGDSFGMAWSLL